MRKGKNEFLLQLGIRSGVEEALRRDDGDRYRRSIEFEGA